MKTRRTNSRTNRRNATEEHAAKLAEAKALAKMILSDLGDMDSRGAKWADVGDLTHVVEMLSRVAVDTTQDAMIKAEMISGSESNAYEMAITKAMG